MNHIILLEQNMVTDPSINTYILHNIYIHMGNVMMTYKYEQQKLGSTLL